jgi:hypothetical protein
VTANVLGDCVQAAKQQGYHAYYANGVTAVETRATTGQAARKIAAQFGTVLFIFW